MICIHICIYIYRCVNIYIYTDTLLNDISISLIAMTGYYQPGIQDPPGQRSGSVTQWLSISAVDFRLGPGAFGVPGASRFFGENFPDFSGRFLSHQRF